ncbi:MAG: response regulator [Anaerolinea sp.]|nr:response regulator [Anaerolinea sp.]MCC6976353.1 response regulator [Anaerolineae bacterium]CAG0954467.1 Transcriptional regulatory protein DegU [Anaerolineae bacterium]
MITIALADDHPLIRKILRQELERSLDFQVLWEVGEPDQLLSAIHHQPPDVLVLDLTFSGTGFEPAAAVRDLRARLPALKILILTAQDDPVWVEELLRAGAHGYVVKSDDLSLRLAEAIRAVAAGRPFLSPSAAGSLVQAKRRFSLTPRERAILRLAAEGRSNPEIAQALAISDGTVRNHISNIYTKLNVTTREAAIKAAQQLRELPKPNAGLRHELRTPLHTLMGLARLLETKLGRDGHIGADSAPLIQQIVLEAERLDHLIGDLME